MTWVINLNERVVLIIMDKLKNHYNITIYGTHVIATLYYYYSFLAYIFGR